MTRVLLVDDHRVLREGLAYSLSASGLDVVGEAGDGPEALRMVAEVLPDVVLMDISLPSADGVELTGTIVSEHPCVHVVILTMFADGATLSAAIRAGAVGYMVKDCSTSEIVDVVRTVASGDTDMSLELARSLLRASTEKVNGAVLSPREIEVLQLIADGVPTERVAQRLYISAKTVKNHLANIYEKMDTRDRTQAVLQGLKLGIVRLR